MAAVRLLFAIFALVDCIAGSAHASESDVIVSVNGTPISRQELETAVAERAVRTFQVSDPHKIRTLVLKDLILQEIAAQLMNDREVAKNPALGRKLELGRRSLLFEAYVQKSLPASARIQETEVDDFITRHPEFFQDRRMYHFGELIIEAKGEVQAKSIRERLKLLAELLKPTSEQFDAVAQWAASNGYEYGVVKDWKATEKLPAGLDQTLLALDKKENKVQIDSKKFDFRAVVLFGAYPDPINPIFAKNSVAQRLAKEAAEKQAQPIISEMLARSNVVLYDKAFNDLNLPKTLAPFQKNEPGKFVDRLFFAWNFAFVVLIPAALYRFFIEKTIDYEDPSLGYFDYMSHQFLFRLGFVVIVGGLMLLLAVAAALRSFDPQDTKNLAIAALGGLVGGGALVFSIAAIPRLGRAFASRWSAVFVVAAAQILLMVTLGPDFS
jgi:EpsD family peptidyl-prolyl cis-trans isomerase